MIEISKVLRQLKLTIRMLVEEMEQKSDSSLKRSGDLAVKDLEVVVTVVVLVVLGRVLAHILSSGITLPLFLYFLSSSLLIMWRSMGA